MFCKKCGKKIGNDAAYCPHCGTRVRRTHGDVFQSADSREPLLVLKPHFIGRLKVLTVLPIQLFMTVWGAGFFGGFGFFAVRALNLPVPKWVPFTFFGSLFFFGIPFIVYVAGKRTYALTEYRFFKDRLEYAEGFWTVENKTIKYDKITETAMRRGILQKRYGLGTIYLSTPATGFQGGRMGSGIRIRDIEEPEKNYKTIENLIGN